jgi:hypothetical protein
MVPDAYKNPFSFPVHKTSPGNIFFYTHTSSSSSSFLSTADIPRAFDYGIHLQRNIYHHVIVKLCLFLDAKDTPNELFKALGRKSKGYR